MNDIFEKHKLWCGQMISANKTSPKGNICIFNANVISPSKGKIWFGDLNLTKDGNKLKEISEELNEPLYILREMDARFGTELTPAKDLINKAVWSTRMMLPTCSEDLIQH